MESPTEKDKSISSNSDANIKAVFLKGKPMEKADSKISKMVTVFLDYGSIQSPKLAN